MQSNIFSNRLIVFILAAIIIIGLEFRLHSVISTVVDHPIRADAKDYLAYAYNIRYLYTYSRNLTSNTDTLSPDALRSPGYPLFVSLFLDKRISHKAVFHVLVTQALLSTLVILLTYAVFFTILGAPIALLAALLTALSPHLITVNVYLLSETWFCFLLMSFLWILSKLKSEPHPIILLCLGATLAAASLTRPWLQYFIFLLIPLLLFFRSLSQPRRVSVYVAVGFFTIMALWIIRNIVTLGISTDSTLMINTLHHGLYPNFMYEHRPESFGFPYRFDPRTSEISASLQSVLTEIVRRFKEMPIEHLQWYLLGKPVTLFSWNIIQGMGDVFIYPVIRTPYYELAHFKVSHEIMRFIHLPLVIFSVIGSFIAWVPKEKLRLSEPGLFMVRCISLLFGYFILLHMVVAPFPRYSIPMQPIIYGMALFGGLQLFLWMKAKYDNR